MMMKLRYLLAGAVGVAAVAATPFIVRCAFANDGSRESYSAGDDQRQRDMGRLSNAPVGNWDFRSVFRDHMTGSIGTPQGSRNNAGRLSGPV
jgi:hypothetical protein